MKENFLNQTNIIIAILILVVLGGGGYYGYTLFVVEDQTISESVEIDTSFLDPNLIAFINAKSKINLKHKDISFLNPGPAAEIYKLLIDNTETIPMTDSRGRPDPFTPYATTGPIR